ncbi:YcxB family protein [Sphingomonas immobilis]|uniref:YcxB family protein n=1 Tax=Sphingomonas immobilis TaxID=3063997 RepID=UPI00272C3991|nr:YcxB family protein [Sphingomonas sp. CA1-15]
MVAATRANYLWLIRRKPALRAGVIIAVCAGIGSALEPLLDKNGQPPLTMPLFFIAGFMVGASLWGLLCLLALAQQPARARRVFRQQRSIHKPFVYSWSDDGLEWTSASGGARFAWNELHGWRESPATFVIYSSESLFQFLPRHAFAPGMEDDLRATLVRSGLPVY